MASEKSNSISWQAPEFREYEKNLGWYITLAAISILVIGFFIIQSDIFAGISTGIVAVFIFIFSKQKPQTVEIELNSRGVKFSNVSYPYKQIKYFWVVHNQNHRTVIFHTTALLNNVIILELEDQDPEKIRQFLLQHLPEHEETEATVPQKIMHKFKF